MIENYYALSEYNFDNKLFNNTKYVLEKSYFSDNFIKNIFYFDNFYFTVFTKNISNYYKTFVYISDKEGNFITENKKVITNPSEIYLDDKNLLLTDIDYDIKELHYKVLYEIFNNLVISYNCYDFKRFNI